MDYYGNKGNENRNEFQPFYIILKISHFIGSTFFPDNMYMCMCVCVSRILSTFCMTTDCFSLSWTLFYKGSTHILLPSVYVRPTVELLVEISSFFKLENVPMINSISILVGINLIVVEKAHTHTPFTCFHTTFRTHTHTRRERDMHAHSSKPNEMVSSGVLSIQHFHIHHSPFTYAILIEVKWLRLLACTVQCSFLLYNLIIMIAH